MKNQNRRDGAYRGFLLIMLGVILLGSNVSAQRGGGRGFPPNMPNMDFPQPKAQRQPQPQIQQPQQPQTGQPQPYVLKLYVDEAGVMAEILNCPLQTVLQNVAERTGIIFEMRVQDNLPVSLRPNQSLELTEFIKRIASGSNTQFFYSQGESPRIALVRIFPRTELPQPSVVYLGTGEVTKGNDDFFNPGQALRVLQESKSAEAREKAINYLVLNKNEGSADVLIKCISDPEPKIRVAAIEGLASLSARSALPAIIKSLKDSQPSVRQSATAAVALIGDYKNVRDLKPLTYDKDANVVTAANIAIQKLSAIPNPKK
jgi:hypothetical protein